MLTLPIQGVRVSETKKVALLRGIEPPHSRRARQTATVLPVRRSPQPILVKGVARPIEVKFASTESEWEQALALAATCYQARGYEPSNGSRLRFTPYHALPETATLVAKLDGVVVATFSIVIDNTLLGLPMESVYPEEIAALRRSGRKLLETTTLADSGLSIREFIQVFTTLIKLGMQYHTSRGGDCYVIAVNPRHRNFYTKILGFEPLGPRRSYGAVQDHPAEAFWVDNNLLQINAPKMFEEIHGEPLPPEALFAPKMPHYLVREFSRQSSHCDPQEIDTIRAFAAQHGGSRRW
jgi:hypothetical protein